MVVTHPTHPICTGDLTGTGTANPQTVSDLADTLRRWLAERLHLDRRRHADVVLAAYEALANSADHAYRDHDHHGTVTLQATHDAPTHTVQICITDHGSWVEDQPPLPQSSRGRGLLLMRTLADDITVNGRLDGTTVCLHFHDCPPVPQSA